MAEANRREPDLVEDFEPLATNPIGRDFVITPVNASSQLIELAWTDESVAPARPDNGEFAAARLQIHASDR